ncbi:MAG: succinate dehydrogenase assembly factor 2 [Burkholderiaceae bacterium]|jgi:antitoxin CptB|nr:succinate dehydrogenase assembly factor 2 [Burkholderiaceae bacterium]
MDDKPFDTLPDADPLPAAALSKLRWRCRRGLLENDLFIERFFNRHAADMTVGQARSMYALIELADNDLLDVLLGRPHTQDIAQQEDVKTLLSLMQA